MSDQLNRAEATKMLEDTLGGLSDEQMLSAILDLEFRGTPPSFPELPAVQKFTYTWLTNCLIERNLPAILIHNGAAWGPYMKGGMTPEEINALPTFLDSAKAVVRARGLKDWTNGE